MASSGEIMQSSGDGDLSYPNKDQYMASVEKLEAEIEAIQSQEESLETSIANQEKEVKKIQEQREKLDTGVRDVQSSKSQLVAEANAIREQIHTIESAHRAKINQLQAEYKDLEFQNTAQLNKAIEDANKSIETSSSSAQKKQLRAQITLFEGQRARTESFSSQLRALNKSRPDTRELRATRDAKNKAALKLDSQANRRQRFQGIAQRERRVNKDMNALLSKRRNNKNKVRKLNAQIKKLKQKFDRDMLKYRKALLKRNTVEPVEEVVDVEEIDEVEEVDNFEDVEEFEPEAESEPEPEPTPELDAIEFLEVYFRGLVGQTESQNGESNEEVKATSVPTTSVQDLNQGFKGEGGVMLVSKKKSQVPLPVRRKKGKKKSRKQKKLRTLVHPKQAYVAMDLLKLPHPLTLTEVENALSALAKKREYYENPENRINEEVNRQNEEEEKVERSRRRRASVKMMDAEQQRRVAEFNQSLADASSNSKVERQQNQDSAIRLMEQERERILKQNNDLENIAQKDRKQNQDLAGQLMDEEQERLVQLESKCIQEQEAERLLRQEQSDEMFREEQQRRVQEMKDAMIAQQNLRKKNRRLSLTLMDEEQRRRVEEFDANSQKISATASLFKKQ